jgi:hypothetical protein
MNSPKSWPPDCARELVSPPNSSPGCPVAGGAAAQEGSATAPVEKTAIIAAMTNATVTNNNKRLIMRYLLSAKDEARQSRRVT